MTPPAAAGHAVPLPRRAGVPATAALLTVVVWGVVAHDSGSGWVQAVGALVTGLLVVGLAGPAVAVARVRCRVLDGPADAVAGSPVHLSVAVSAPAEVRGADPPGPPALSGRAPQVVVAVTPPGRGVLEAVRVTVASAAPWGLTWWTRTVVLPLPRPIAVAPRTGAPGLGVPVAAAGGAPDAAASATAPGAGSEPRGVRAYDVGDRPHLVHWPATAHTGMLMVRELERVADRQVALDARLPDDPAAAERAAEAHLGTVAALLAAGVPVRLRTAEPRGLVDAPVASVREAGRRLAMALPRTGGRGAGTAP